MSAAPALVFMLGVVVVVLWIRQRRDTPLGELFFAYVCGAVFLSGIIALLFFDSSHARFFGVMSLLFVAGFFVAPVYLVGVALLAREKRRGWALFSLVSALILVAIGVDASVVEPHALEVNRFEVRGRLPEGMDRLRVVVLSDIQTARPGDYEAEVLRRAAALQPDLVLFPGDYVQAGGARYERGVTRLGELIRASGLGDVPGVAVAGDVEPPNASWTRLFADTRIVPLGLTETRTMAGVDITALGYFDSASPDTAVGRRERFHIAVGHRPAFALGDVQADLLIAGHTHGGQVQLPGVGPLMTLSVVPREMAEGLTQLEGGRTLIVSRGIGMERGEAPPIRFLCPPEIVVVDVLPE